MDWPTPHLIEVADHLQLAKWHRFLPTPSGHNEEVVLSRIHDLFMVRGGYTTEINDTIGYDKSKLEE